MEINWVLETDVFPDKHQRLIESAQKQGHNVFTWQDRWWKDRSWPSLGGFTIFHGSLNNADRIRREQPWSPGAFCNGEQFLCSHWYPHAAAWLVHPCWVRATLREFVEDPAFFLETIGSPTSFFARPDSPLKPFSGRVLRTEGLSLASFDYGFYHEDKDLPIILTPVQTIGEEYRFVISEQTIITASSYEAETRKETAHTIPQAFLSRAQEIASQLPAPEPLYVLDLCAVAGEIKLLEINPFSGADLYGCDRDAIVRCVEGIAKREESF
ncbi:MAG: ATP-grasp domain-containing protein [Myxococcales bacterium]|nr:ATP-grasp domain-containing protein [Myxococcales bacterium]